MQSADLYSSTAPAPVPAQAAYSRFFQRLHRRYAEELALLPPGPPTRASMEAALAVLMARGPGGAAGLGVALRILRQIVM